MRGKAGRLRELVTRIVRPAESTRAEPNAAHQPVYHDLLLRQTDITRRLHAGSYL